MGKRVLVTVPLEKGQAESLRRTGAGCEFRFRSTDGRPLDPSLGFGPLERAEILAREDVEWAEVILGNVPAHMLSGSEGLEWMQTGSAGVEDYLKPGVLHENTVLTNSTGAYGLAISEYMLGVLLELMKQLELYRDAQRNGSWRSLGGVSSVYGSTVLILGMGDIGGEFGRRCKALGAEVIGVRRNSREKPDYADEVHLPDDLDSLLPRADVVAVTLPGTEETRGLLGRDRLELMKDGAYLLNVGRGYIVDTDALCVMLESGRLSGAGLDVTDPEPLPPDHPLWKVPTAVITPHISGYYHLKETHTRIFRLMEENLRRFLDGEKLVNRVDRSAGYRETL